MNRLLKFALALGFAALAGCDGSDPPGDVDIYWGFVRNTAQGAKLYDATDPGGTADAACAESGVEYVRLTASDGREIDPGYFVEGFPTGAIPCVNYGVHGVTERAIRPGTHAWTVTGYRTFNGTEIPVAQSSVTFDVRSGRANRVEVQVQPIQDDVQLVPVPWNTGNTAPISCPVSGIGEIDVFISTYIGDPVVSETVRGCGPMTVRLDREDYDVRLRGFASSTATDPTHDSTAPTTRCETATIAQLGPQGAGTSWSIDMRYVVGATPCQ